MLASTAAFGAAQIAAGTFLIEGQTPGDRQPDGNTIVLVAPKGLIVFDTGRHEEHTRKIIEFARAQNRPIAAIVNSHWHMDHIGGNPLLRAAFPKAEVYASDAIEEARRTFLAKYRARLAEELAKTPNKDMEAEIGRLDQGALLGPTRVVADSKVETIAGRSLHLHVETQAVTAKDVWVYDPGTRVLLAGDLVTLPAPFFDTACPQRWLESLGRLEQTPFLLLVPGHGKPMSRAEFAVYRKAYADLLACAASDATKVACIDGWASEAGSLIDPKLMSYARELLGYYLDDPLRAKERPNCPAA